MVFHGVSLRCFMLFHCCFMLFHAVSCCFTVFHAVSMFSLLCFILFHDASSLCFMVFQGVSLPCFILFHDHETGTVGTTLHTVAAEASELCTNCILYC